MLSITFDYEWIALLVNLYFHLNIISTKCSLVFKNIKMKYFRWVCFLLVIVSGLFSCIDNEHFSTDPHLKLDFAVDTIAFDTIFTTIGSTTKRFTVRNTNSSAIELSTILLSGNSKSPFRLNINGVSGNRLDNLQIPAKDSIFIFVEVTVDPTGENLPMVIHDSIVFNWNGNSEDVDLVAYGQDVYLYNGEVLKSQKWKNDKPYLIYNSVLVDSKEVLEVEQGCRIHFHKGSSLFVKGTLEVDGTFEEPVYFQGDRLEEKYSDLPDQWGAYQEFENYIIYYGGIHFLKGSENNVIDYAVIRNAIKGIQVDSLGSTPEPVLNLKNTIIENMTLNCLDARTSFVKASNCIFANSSSNTVRLLFGGRYEFNHCTLANYYDISVRQEPILFLNNYYEYENKVYAFDFNSRFANCIIYGELLTELKLDYVSDAVFDPYFTNCLVQMGKAVDLPDENFKECVFNTDPIFVDKDANNFALDSISPAIGIADVNYSLQFPFDLMLNSRLNDEGPDIGALEWVGSE